MIESGEFPESSSEALRIRDRRPHVFDIGRVATLHADNSDATSRVQRPLNGGFFVTSHGSLFCFRFPREIQVCRNDSTDWSVEET